MHIASGARVKLAQGLEPVAEVSPITPIAERRPDTFDEARQEHEVLFGQAGNTLEGSIRLFELLLAERSGTGFEIRTQAGTSNAIWWSDLEHLICDLPDAQSFGGHRALDANTEALLRELAETAPHRTLSF